MQIVGTPSIPLNPPPGCAFSLGTLLNLFDKFPTGQGSGSNKAATGSQGSCIINANYPADTGNVGGGSCFGSGKQTHTHRVNTCSYLYTDTATDTGRDRGLAGATAKLVKPIN